MNQQPSEYLVLIFSVDAYTFCVPALEVESVIKRPLSAITSVPGSPKAVSGVLAHRGQIVTVINLRQKLGLTVSRETASGLLIISRMDDGLTAFRADDVSDVISSAAVQWHPVTVNTSFTAVDKLGTYGDLFLMHARLQSLALMEDSPQQDSQFLRFAEALGFRSSSNFETVRETVRYDECKITLCSDANSSEEKACKADNIQKPLSATGVHPPPKLARTHHKQVFSVKTGKPSTIFQAGTPPVSMSNIQASPAPTIPSKTRPVDILKAGRPAQAPEMGRPASPGTAGDALEKASTHAAKAFGDGDDPDHGRQAAADSLSTPVSRNRRSRFLWIAAVGIIASGLLLGFLTRPGHHNHETANDILSKPISFGTMATAPAKPSGMHALPEAVPAFAGEESKEERQANADPPHLAVSEKPPDESTAQSTGRLPVAETVEDIVEDTETVEVQPVSDPVNNRHQELLRVESKDFTLTVERPRTDGSILLQSELLSEGQQFSSGEMLVHIVVKGDTLWDIAKSYLGNPMLYPELAELSRIKDPHWIYPRDVIRIVRRY